MSDKYPKGILLYWGEYIGNIYATIKPCEKLLFFMNSAAPTQRVNYFLYTVGLYIYNIGICAVCQNSIIIPTHERAREKENTSFEISYIYNLKTGSFPSRLGTRPL